MKKLSIAGPLLVTLSGISAPAAAEPVTNWTGFYIGANGGYGWSKDSTTAAPFQNIPPAFGQTLIPYFTLSNPVNGAVFGGQLGYNYQIAPTWVIGVEGDFDGTGLNGGSQSILPEPFNVRSAGVTNSFSAREKVEWLASVRVRLGYAWGPSLFYVTGGGAWERVSDNFLLSTSFLDGEFGSSSAGSASATLSGYAVGGGYEWKINPNWTVRAEYLHYGFSGSSNTSIFATCTGFFINVVCGSNVSSSNHNIDVVRLGVNYGISALAADMPAEAPLAAQPVPNWTGFYIGANGGYGWSKDSTTAAPFQNFPPFLGKTLIPFFTLSNPVNGAVFGGQLGYNYQIAPTWVIGVEGDFDGTGLNGGSQSILPAQFAVFPGVTNGFSAHENVEWLASVRARLGYAWGPSLFYVTGGGAWERVSDNFLLSTSFAGLGLSDSSSAGSATATLSGYAAGGGYEWKINPNWTVRAEYLHYGFSGSSNTSIFATCTGFAPFNVVCGSNVSSSNRNIDVVRLAVNYMW